MYIEEIFLETPTADALIWAMGVCNMRRQVLLKTKTCRKRQLDTTSWISYYSLPLGLTIWRLGGRMQQAFFKIFLLILPPLSNTRQPNFSNRNKNASHYLLCANLILLIIIVAACLMVASIPSLSLSLSDLLLFLLFCFFPLILLCRYDGLLASVGWMESESCLIFPVSI